jgi:hypothetical protein
MTRRASAWICSVLPKGARLWNRYAFGLSPWDEAVATCLLSGPTWWGHWSAYDDKEGMHYEDLTSDSGPDIVAAKEKADQHLIAQGWTLDKAVEFGDINDPAAWGTGTPCVTVAEITGTIPGTDPTLRIIERICRFSFFASNPNAPDAVIDAWSWREASQRHPEPNTPRHRYPPSYQWRHVSGPTPEDVALLRHQWLAYVGAWMRRYTIPDWQPQPWPPPPREGT